MLKLDLVQTVAFGGIVLFAGYGIKRAVPLLSRYNIPAPVIGGLLVSLAITLARGYDVALVQFDTTLRNPLMFAFFTSIGFGASVALLRRGGAAVVLFLVASTVVAVVQNLLGGAVARGLGQPPLLGVLAGSVALAGGPATGLAFAKDFEAAGITGAETLAVAAAMAGILSGGLLGGPIGTFLIERRRLRDRLPGTAPPTAPPVATDAVPGETRVAAEAVPPPGEDIGAYALLKGLVLILVAMWLGSGVSAGLASLGVTLPGYIGAMIVAILIRNLDDVTGIVGVPPRLLDDLGNVALSLFLVVALMSLELWKIAALALPLLVILTAQVAFLVAVCLPMFRLMGRDYEAAVMASGFCGFMLGTTANAMANMTALVERYGPAPKAFLVVPMVGAFFIDATNALIITAFLNLWR